MTTEKKKRTKNPETTTIDVCLRAIGALDKSAQSRVVKYIADVLGVHLDGVPWVLAVPPAKKSPEDVDGRGAAG